MTGFCPSFKPLRCGRSIFRFCQSLLTGGDFAAESDVVFVGGGDNEDVAVFEVSVIVDEVEGDSGFGVKVSGLSEDTFDLLTCA